MMLDWNEDGDIGWFDACRMLGRDSLDAVLPRTSYLVSAEYAAWDVEGPRDMRSPDYGFVIKAGAIREDCYEAGVGEPITPHGGQETGVWKTVSGVWESGDANFLPTLQIALENATGGFVFVRSLSVRELRSDGSLGPEILTNPSMDYVSYVSQKKAYELDQIVEMAEAAGVHLKLVVSDKDDEAWLKLANDGSFVTGDDNADGYFGLGRELNKTRWLQRAWWRYLQARWGYSAAIHSWELLNEGNPASESHFLMADEFGRYMKYGVFDLTPPEGYAPAGAALHPNAHLVTTSFWHSFPCDEVWRNGAYRFLDYADLHAYVSTSYAPLADREAMQYDAALYHLWHSESTANCAPGKPVLRGEGGLDTPDSQLPDALGLERDEGKLWLHNFVWSTLDAGAMGEIYWWAEHLSTEDGFQLQPFRVLASFLADVELNKGGYSESNATSSDGGLRIVGQKNTAAGRMHLWIQNRANTWRQSPPPGEISGTVTVDGFEANTAFGVEYWDTRSGATSSATLQSSAAGALTIPVQGLRTDLAVKVYRQAN
jgi:hypothetical protein